MTPLQMSSNRVRRFLTPLLALSMALPAFAQVANNPTTKPEEGKKVPVEKTVPVETVPVEKSTGGKTEEPMLELSPFIVTTSRDTGYFAENTLAGSRMNTNVSDLGASISVITKQLLDDTGSIDINDVFRYEINTEGSSTYTPAVASFRNDGVLDVNAGGTQGGTVASFTNATANRVRGIGVPSFAINNYPAISAIPMDSYNVQRLEISRGPNSMLFGMGSPAGIVNQSSSQAVLNRNSETVQVRVDHNGSHRGSFSFNRGLIDDKLAIYGAVLYNNQQFERKPSYDKSKRAFGAVTIKPFSKTTIRASVEGYENDNRRPNSLTPRDFVTEWNLAGRPAWNPVTQMVTIGATGKVVGPFIVNSAHPRAQEVRNYILSQPGYSAAGRGGQPAGQTVSDTNFTTYNDGRGATAIFGNTALTNTGSIMFVPGLGNPAARPTMFIADGQVTGFYSPSYNTRPVQIWGSATDPRGTNRQFPTADSAIWGNAAWADVFNRQILGGASRPVPTTLSNYRIPGVTDQSVYDWENININQMNFGRDTNTTYNVEFDQEILSNLYLSAGWFRQDFMSHTNYTVGQLNAPALLIDPNTHLIDGTPNPYFGKPYVEDQDPDRFRHTQNNDSYRAMLAYTPDFTQRGNWLRWLGRHQILGLWSRDTSYQTNWRFRPAFVDAATLEGKYRFLNNQNPTAAGGPSGWAYQQNLPRRVFYLASASDPVGTGVTRSSGEFNNLTYKGDIRAYNYETSQWQNYNVTWDFNAFDAPAASYRDVQSRSGGITSYLWNERLVTTFGVRRDEYKARVNTTGAYTGDDGVARAALSNQDKFPDGRLNTDLVLNRWNKFDRLIGTTKTMGGVFRPFRNWNTIESRANGGSLFWEFVRDFGISYNKSDNFNPPPSAQVDLFGNALPKPQGEGEDIGFQFSVLKNKVFGRVTWFEATNTSERAPAGNALRVRDLLDVNQFRDWARTIARINMGDDPRVASSWDTPIPVGSEKDLALQAAAAKIWQLPYNYFNELPGSVALTRDAKAKGIEAQLNYNPTSNWTVRATFGKQDTVYDNVLKEVEAWIDHRMPLWTTAKASDYLLPQYQGLATYTTEGGRAVDLRNFWSSHDYNSDVRSDNVFGNTTVENFYRINVKGNVDLARDLQGQRSPGQRRHRASVMTNYKFGEGRFKGFEVGGVQRWEDKMILGYYGKASGADVNNPTRLDTSDTNKPIWDDGNFYTDVWVSYNRRILKDKVKMKLQFNVENIFEGGSLRVVNVDYNGTANGFRIIDPRRYLLTATFDF
jgi:outer membrane receptor protein involved in Fe transport